MRYRGGFVAVIMAFALLVLSGCATGATAPSQSGGFGPPDCDGDVKLLVENESAADVRLPGIRQRAFPAMRTDSVIVHRTRIRRHIAARIARGGMNRKSAERIISGSVDCDVATLILRDPLRYSMFFGARMRR